MIPRGTVRPSNPTYRALFIAASIASTATFFNLPTVLAQDDTGAPQPSDLQAVEQDLKREQATKDSATKQAERAATDAAKLQSDMIGAARSIQERERALTDLEAQLVTLEEQRAEMAATLIKKDTQMREVLLALERLAVRPTDALLLQPLRPSDAIRSGLVLSAAIPALTKNAAQLQIELETLYATRTAIVDRRSTLALEALSLIDDQTRLERLYTEKASLQRGFERQATDAEKRIEALAREANDLRDLLDRVIAERKRQDAEEAERAAREAPILTPPDGAAPTPDIVAARRPSPPVAARSFSKARGTLPFPAEGRLSQRYGENTDGDGLAKGIVITTRTAAQVVSPFDGVVAFSGPFRGYGQLLILEHSEGYHTLLAGMSRLDGAVGQRVLAGEPVGVMSPEGDPSLYVELRRDGQPINPLPWLATRTNEKSG
ncbi:MAG: peptidoglycan DD-metalloendopeptidase family protein [Alphaproteobacteria bacterium]|nr:peptidoglycan DD-metalloendopeptidase family protein [Alphaproteobacteria bacterium]